MFLEAGGFERQVNLNAGLTAIALIAGGVGMLILKTARLAALIS